MIAMSAKSVKLTRQQLHQEVWKTPIHRLSEKYGLSDVGLAKACKRMDIPRPPRGYWRKKETGLEVHRAPLPKPKEGTQLEIEFDPSDRPARGWKRGERDSDSTPQPLELVASLLSPEVHSLVTASLKHYERAKEGKDGILSTKAKRCVPISVSRDHLDRSLRLLDAVFRAWEDKGNRVEIPTSEEGRAALLCAGEEAIEITIVEEVKEIELEPTEEELLQPKWTWKRRVEARPSGKLTVSLAGNRIAESRSFHRRYRDGLDAPVEERGGRILQAALEYVEARRLYREEAARKHAEWRERQRQWDLEWQRREEARRRREEEARRVEALLEAAEKWNRARRLREFIEACEAEIIATKGSGEKAEKWTAWARSIADGLDPLKTGYLDDAGASILSTRRNDSR